MTTQLTVADNHINLRQFKQLMMHHLEKAGDTFKWVGWWFYQTALMRQVSLSKWKQKCEIDISTR